jgi:hypothetical protein
MMDIIKEDFWDDFLFQHFEKTKRYEKIDNKALFEDFKKNDMLDTLVEIIMSDPHFSSLDDPNYLNDKQVIDGIEKSFKKIYLLCNKKTQESVKKYIFKKLDFSNYFYSDELWEIEDEYYNDADSTISYENYTYEQLKVDELLPKLKKEVLKKVLDYAFESQKGNKLLIITFFTRNKIEDKEFIQELQKNYGIYLEVDTFIKEMNQALKNIKTYKQFFEYIKSDFGNNMTEEDMRQILAGLPVQMPGQPGPDLDNGPRFPPLSQAEINQIFANIPPQPRISQAEIDQIFARTPVRSLTTEEMNQIFSSIPQPPNISEEELNRIFSGVIQNSNISGAQVSQTFSSLPQY